MDGIYSGRYLKISLIFQENWQWALKYYHISPPASCQGVIPLFLPVNI